MTQLKAIIVEDEFLMSTVLCDLITENHKNITILDTAINGKEAIRMIDQLKPELVFLDVELPDMNAFEMLDQLKEINFQTIFTTAHSQYAIKAFRFNALDYLVKPIIKKELKEAINRFKLSGSNVNQALQNLREERIEEQKLQLQTHQGLLHFRLKNITRIVGERNYSYIHLDSGLKELSSKTLSYFEEILDDKGFYRCHRSFLINKHHIESMNKDGFVLTNGDIIPVSRRKKVEARAWFSAM